MIVKALLVVVSLSGYYGEVKGHIQWFSYPDMAACEAAEAPAADRRRARWATLAPSPNAVPWWNARFECHLPRIMARVVRVVHFVWSLRCP